MVSKFTQVESHTISPVTLGAYVLAVIVVSLATLAPKINNVDPNLGLGPFSRQAEMQNGRAAMLGFAGLLIWEFVVGKAFF